MPGSDLQTAHRGSSQKEKREVTTTMPFTCSICEEESTHICVACTKDSCDNHLCEKCSRCSDCCGCEVRLNETEPNHSALVGGTEPLLAAEPASEPAGIPAEDIPGEAADKDFAG